jgi:hypothetical protein
MAAAAAGTMILPMLLRIKWGSFLFESAWHPGSPGHDLYACCACS